MSDLVMKVEHLSKRYRIGQYVGGAYQYRALRDVLTDAMHAPFRSLRARSKQRVVGSTPTADSHELSAMSHEPSTNFIWALKDVSFGVKQSEVIGIIGRNGAGKSTLLKVLSRITEPTEGRAEIKGRVGSLLEVGTGFHPELTGRENIYLSGAILGMTKKEISQKFDEMVDFSGIEKFIDTPIKRYSSGMLVRLGFAVAAHLEPEILIVDEVLAVGDAAFRKKCLGKMEDVAKGGRTVLFVSHNMGAIQNLTRRCLLLENGCINFIGEPRIAVQKYLGTHLDNSRSFEVRNLECDPDGFSISKFYFDYNRVEKGFNKPLYFVLNLDLERDFSDVSFGFGIVNSIGSRIMTLERTIPTLKKGSIEISFILEDPRLPPGNYSIDIGFGTKSSQIIYRENVLAFTLSVENVDSVLLVTKKDRLGVFRIPKYEIDSGKS